MGVKFVHLFVLPTHDVCTFTTDQFELNFIRTRSSFEIIDDRGTSKFVVISCQIGKTNLVKGLRH